MALLYRARTRKTLCLSQSERAARARAPRVCLAVSLLCALCARALCAGVRGAASLIDDVPARDATRETETAREWVV